ncbi:MAG TPA: 2Fe-2S iron-sulfur cluster binding domain-containing protein [Polyangia bacterium]|nr:2Fe-2S iron-sulfur cluster binding domain-containing protein [Polyangia bacterium]
MKLTVQTADGVHQIQASADQQILRAALCQGIHLPYDCATGTCGTCRVRLLAGQASDGWPEAPGARRCGAGDILSCQGVALTDCTLSVSRLRPPAPGTGRPEALTGVLRRRRLLAPDVMRFDVSLARPFEFAAGQFVLLETAEIPGARAYSIAGARRGGMDVWFLARRKVGGRFTRWLFDRGAGIEGARLELFGPLGRATFHPAARTPILCVAGGTGLAGMLAILGRAGESGHFDEGTARLLFGVRTNRDLFLLDQLSALRANRPDRLKIDVALSDEEPHPDLAARYPALSFHAGLVDAVLARTAQPPPAGTRAYLAGPRAMVDAALRVLVQHGRLPPQDVRYDRFD